MTTPSNSSGTTAAVNDVLLEGTTTSPPLAVYLAGSRETCATSTSNSGLMLASISDRTLKTRIARCLRPEADRVGTPEYTCATRARGDVLDVWHMFMLRSATTAGAGSTVAPTRRDVKRSL